MKKNTKLKVISAAIGLLAVSSANAQWATIDMANVAQTSITAAKSTLSAVYDYYSMMANGANGQSIQQTTQAVNLLQKQSVINTQTQDLLNRKAMGDAKTGDIIMQMMPSVESCIEASQNTDNTPRTAAGRASSAGAGGGPQGSPARSAAVVSTATAQAQLLKKMTTLGTCIKELDGAAGCSSIEGDYAGADMHPRGIKGNVKGVKRDEDKGPAYNNYTLDDDGFKVAKSYASDMSYYDKPKVPSSDQLKKNPSYAALYKSTQTKLEAAHDAVLDIAKFKRASDTDISSSIPGKMWAAITNDEYKKVTGLATKPGNKPSMFEVINYEVKNDYYGNEKADLKSMEEVNKRLALSNYLNWQKYQQQENTNILLAHILVQLTTPVNKTVVDNEYAKTMNAK